MAKAVVIEGKPLVKQLFMTILFELCEFKLLRSFCHSFGDQFFADKADDAQCKSGNKDETKDFVKFDIE